MSMKYLGESFDIHGGGLENQFPHHEGEIAQSEGATGKPFVTHWLHNNMVTVGDRKMGKSLGNFVTLKDAFKKWRPEVIRFFILQSHYRSTLDFSDKAVEASAEGFERLANTVRNLRERLGSSGPTGHPLLIDLEKYRRDFGAAMDDDFNTPQAIAVLFDLSREVNQYLHQDRSPDQDSLRRVLDLFEHLGGGILGIITPSHDGPKSTNGQIEPELMKLIIDLRQELRAQRLWALSDRIRSALARLGIVLEDKREGTSWKRLP
jgi:cysteinyl-tRNA synthetase